MPGEWTMHQNPDYYFCIAHAKCNIIGILMLRVEKLHHQHGCRCILKAENTSLRDKFYSITKKMHTYWNQNIAQIPFITLQIYMIPESLHKTPLFLRQPPAKVFWSTVAA
jgi:hypothetical protein